MFSTSTIIFAVAAVVLVLILQAFLSSREFHYLGLILPILTFAFCIYVMSHFKELIGDHGFEGYQVWGWYGLQVFIGNIPTFILLLIYSLFKPKFNDDDDDYEDDDDVIYYSFDDEDDGYDDYND
ncbi:MAG: hypothetical protein Q4D77_06235 [Peptostreptococcaceae bacterium]|nr:hypothetical protein [Peptostreptococcaceae bacterium]